MSDFALDSAVAFKDTARPHTPRGATPGLGFSLRGLTRSFGDKPVLKGVDLDVAPGQFLAIVGRSGCGKSTLLRLLAGLDTPSSGSVDFDGATTRPTRMMFQEPRLLPWARLIDNVAVGLSGLGRDVDVEARALALLGEVGLADRAGDWPSVLSGGQKQRVALARALASQPRILALDEPLGALDALTRIEMQQLLERIWLQQRFTAVLVTHDVAEAVALADRIVVVEEGRIALDVMVDIPRPRRRGAPELARLEGEVLDHLLGR